MIKPTDQGNYNGTKSVKIEATFIKQNGLRFLKLLITNYTNTNITNFDAKIKPNYFGINFTNLELLDNVSISPNTPTELQLQIAPNDKQENVPPATPLIFSVGIKTNIDVFYFNLPCMFHILFVNRFLLIIILNKHFRLMVDSWEERTLRNSGNKFQIQMN